MGFRFAHSRGRVRQRKVLTLNPQEIFGFYLGAGVFLAPVSFRGLPSGSDFFTDSDYVVSGSPSQSKYHIVKPTFLGFKKYS